MQHRFAMTFFGVASFCLACLPASGGTTPLTTELVATGLTNPLYVTHVPGDFTRVFIVEQPGRIRILDISQNPPVLGATFLDISSIVQSSGFEQGLLGLAFHPNYAINRFFYVNYTRAGGDTVVSRFEMTAGMPNDADEASEQIVMTISQPQSNHNGGWIAFGPNDDLLYIGMGDGGAGDDFGTGHTSGTGNGQDITNNLLGKMLRIDVDSDDFPGDPNVNYAIPASNPFVGITGDDEIWAYGLRNPWRNGFDRATGDLYMGDVGQGDWEEIDFQPANSSGGENWGWRCREGAHDFTTVATTGCAQQVLLDPIHEFSSAFPNSECSVTGGEVYRGCAMPDMHGTYFFADWCSSEIWSFEYTGTVTNFQNRTVELDPPGQSIFNITSFGLDAEGEMYICAQGGDVFRIIPDGVPSQCGVPAIPAVSDWGAVVMVLLLTVSGTLVIRKRAATEC